MAVQHRDKILHGVVWCLIALVFFLIYKRFARLSRRTRIVLAILSSALIGFVKEIGDERNIWPWCDGDCFFDWMDMLANAGGIVFAVFLIHMCIGRTKIREPRRGGRVIVRTGGPIQDEEAGNDRVDTGTIPSDDKVREVRVDE